MKKIIIYIVSVLVLSSCNFTFFPYYGEKWELVAKSDIIASGTLSVPVDSNNNLLFNKDNRYNLYFKFDEIIKGDLAQNILIRWYSDTEFDPSKEQVISFNGKKVLVFLIKSHEAGELKYYFAGYSQKSLIKNT